MPRLPWLSTSFAILLFAGCSPEGAWTADVATHTVEGETIDLHFQPLDLRAGEQVTADLNGVRLTSTARGENDHRITLDAPGRVVRATVGMLDGVARITSPSTGDGGTASAGPTSIHRIVECNAQRCVEVVEYDYDMHDPSGNGTTSWRTPDGRSATIDRLRFELDAVDSKQTAQLRLTTPSPAILVHKAAL